MMPVIMDLQRLWSARAGLPCTDAEGQVPGAKNISTIYRHPGEYRTWGTWGSVWVWTPKRTSQPLTHLTGMIGGWLEPGCLCDFREERNPGWYPTLVFGCPEPWESNKNERSKNPKEIMAAGCRFASCKWCIFWCMEIYVWCTSPIPKKKKWKELSKMGGSKAGGEIAPNRSSPMMRGLKTPNTFWGSVFEPPNAQLQNGFYMI